MCKKIIYAICIGLILTGCSKKGEEAGPEVKPALKSAKKVIRPHLDLIHFLTELVDPHTFAYPPKGQAGFASSFDRSGGNSDWGRLS